MSDLHCLGEKSILKTVPFEVIEKKMVFGAHPGEHIFHSLNCPDWVMVLPVTEDNQAILIRQPRVGIMKNCLEVPGGVTEEHEKKDFTSSVLRELEEETGFVSTKILPLGSFAPNPAFQNNLVHLFLALNCYVPEKRIHFPDHLESISLEIVPVADLEFMVRTGQVGHGLACLCIMLALKYLKV